MECPCKTCIVFPCCRNKYIYEIYIDGCLHESLSIKLFMCPYIKKYYSDTDDLEITIKKDIELYKIYNMPHNVKYTIKNENL